MRDRMLVCGERVHPRTRGASSRPDGSGRAKSEVRIKRAAAGVGGWVVGVGWVGGRACDVAPAGSRQPGAWHREGGRLWFHGVW